MDRPLDLASVLLVQQPHASGREHGVQVHRHAAQLHPAHAAEREQGVHHLDRLGRGAAEHRHVAPLAGVEPGAGALVEQPGETAQLPERSPEVVAHRGGERL